MSYVGQSTVVNSIAIALDFTTDVSKLYVEMHVIVIAISKTFIYCTEELFQHGEITQSLFPIMNLVRILHYETKTSQLTQ